MDHHSFEEERRRNIYYLFRSWGEWSLGKFMVENLTRSQITKFLSLPWVIHDATHNGNGD
ncbi:hypothetical protein J3R82DRAFT_1853 [Butyriboletus roseoflavus]|nr:hypothetical protein J3R82DRAFT_1853 [Butyriboletus roseoflavus]